MGKKQVEKRFESQFLGLRRAVLEAERVWEEQTKSFEVHREVNKGLFLALITILPVSASLQSILYRPAPTAVLGYHLIVGGVMITFIGAVIFALLGFRPVRTYTAFQLTYEDLTGDLCGKGEDEMLAMVVARYLYALDQNRPLIQKRERYGQISFVFTSVMVALMLAINLLPKV